MESAKMTQNELKRSIATQNEAERHKMTQNNPKASQNDLELTENAANDSRLP